MSDGYFAYEKKENGICILRCYGSSGSVCIPGELEGIQVTEISAYAFAEEMEEEPENNSGYPCICGDRLEEVYLPCTIRRLGRYIFYNCLHFRKLSFYSNLTYMGAGAFTGCENLSFLEMHLLAGNSCLREILQDLKQKVTVEIRRVQEGTEESHALSGGTGAIPGENDKNLICRLVYPEFFEEAVENTPARIISTQTHGMGIQYRNAFRNTQVIFEEYDRLFLNGKYNIELTTLIDIAVARIRYPYALEETAGEEYVRWLKEHLGEAAGCFLEQERIGELRWLAEEFITFSGQMEVLLEASKKREMPEVVSMLMDVNHRRFPVKKKRFVL